jgi:hypothetical protein
MGRETMTGQCSSLFRRLGTYSPVTLFARSVPLSNLSTFQVSANSNYLSDNQFLDAQRIHNLVTYLQELHSLGLANSDHTTLLLNTYTKLKDVSRLDTFIKTESRRGDDSDELPFDLETAIRVCRQAGYFEHAGYLAKKYQRHEDYLRIQIEDAGNFKDALVYLRKLGSEAVSVCFNFYSFC